MKQAKVLSKQEFKRLLAVVASNRHASRNRLALMLSFYAGLRVGEIAQLRICDVLNENGTIVDQLHLKAAITKNAHSRTVFFSTKLRKEILAFINSNPVNSSSNLPLIRSQKSNAFSPNSLCQLLARLYSKAAIKNAGSHSGRRSFITQLAHNGISAKVIMELAGHKNLTTTQRYIDVNDELKIRAVEVVI
jgi:integrase/recombinase XerD